MEMHSLSMHGKRCCTIIIYAIGLAQMLRESKLTRIVIVMMLDLLFDISLFSTYRSETACPHLSWLLNQYSIPYGGARFILSVLISSIKHKFSILAFVLPVYRQFLAEQLRFALALNSIKEYL